jgi:TonB family protein
MRQMPTARPLAALVTACLLATPFAPAQEASPSAAPAVATPAATPASAPVAAVTGVQGGDAVKPASTPEAVSAQLVGKMFYLRGFYQDDKLQFATDGKVEGNPQKGSFALSALEIDKVKFTKHSMELQAHRVGLHFFGSLPYEDDSKPFERIKVDPKQAMNIEVERLVIEPEKKKKKKDDKHKDAGKGAPVLASKPAAAAAPAVPAASKDENASLPAAPETQTTAAAAPGTTTAGSTTPERATTESATAGTATAAAAPLPAPGAATTGSPAAGAAPAVAPNHDPRVSFLQLSKALNVMFAPTLDDSVISTLPAYWQHYFATKAGKANAALDASMMRPGGDVKAPQLLTTIDPDSNDYAQKNNIAGMVFLKMVVDASGRPSNVTIVRPIGFGLDEKAVEAIERAQFRPGTLNGKPIPELVNLQVTFRIYSNRTKPTSGKTPPVPTQVAPRESPKGPPSNAPVVAAATVNE